MRSVPPAEYICAHVPAGDIAFRNKHQRQKHVISKVDDDAATSEWMSHVSRFSEGDALECDPAVRQGRRNGFAARRSFGNACGSAHGAMRGIVGPCRGM